MRTFAAGIAAVGLCAVLGAGQAFAQDDNCISDTIEGAESAYQTVIFNNRCNQVVDLAVCLQVSNREQVEQHAWMVSPRGTARLGISLGTQGRVTYRYVYNWCWGTGCPNDIPSCAEDPGAAPPPPPDRGQPPPPQQGPRRL
jgi:hypothetical protein